MQGGEKIAQELHHSENSARPVGEEGDLVSQKRKAAPKGKKTDGRTNMLSVIVLHTLDEDGRGLRGNMMRETF